jgi:hypothetical protein
MTRIMENNCSHCDSPIHKTQEEYHEKREEKLHQTRFSKIEKYTAELRGLRNLLESQFLKRKGWAEEEIAIKFAEREKGHQDIDHIVKTGERLKLH